MSDKQSKKAIVNDEKSKCIESTHAAFIAVEIICAIFCLINIAVLVYVVNDGGYDIFGIVPLLGVAFSATMIVVAIICKRKCKNKK